MKSVTLSDFWAEMGSLIHVLHSAQYSRGMWKAHFKSEIQCLVLVQRYVKELYILDKGQTLLSVEFGVTGSVSSGVRWRAGEEAVGERSGQAVLALSWTTGTKSRQSSANHRLGGQCAYVCPMTSPVEYHGLTDQQIPARTNDISKMYFFFNAHWQTLPC